MHHVNHLQCKSELAGFAKCPELRPANDTESLLCNHLRDNTRRCSTTHESVRTSCRLFEVCDQAVLISGGWNRQTSGARHLDNVASIFGMLRHNGFKRRNIKVFFANGAQPLRGEREEEEEEEPCFVQVVDYYGTIFIFFIFYFLDICQVRAMICSGCRLLLR